MATVRVRLPGLLAQILGGRTQLEVAADTVGDAIGRLLADHPALTVHLYDEAGELRPHVNLFYNDTNIRWLDSLSLPTEEGDTLTVMQAVSGG